MAASRVRERLNYKWLNELCTADLLNEPRRKKRNSNSNMFVVERVISKRQGKKGTEYFIKWKNWPIWTCSWEPLENLNCFAVRSYTEPTIEGWRLEAAAAAFVEAVLGILKCKSVRVSFNTNICIDHDIVRYIFKNKGSIAPDGFNLYMKEDFSRFCLPPFWYYYFDELGEGVSVDFPVKLKTKLGFHSKRFIVNNFGSLEKGPLIPAEKVSVVIIRKACSKNTIT